MSRQLVRENQKLSDLDRSKNCHNIINSKHSSASKCQNGNNCEINQSGMWRTKRAQKKKARPRLGVGTRQWGISCIVAIAIGQTIYHRVEAATLKKWEFDPQTSQLEITIEEGTTPNYFLLADPLRLVIDLPNTQLGRVPTTANYPGLVYRVRVSQFSEDVTRIVLDFFPEETFKVEQIELKQSSSELDNTQWILRPLVSQTIENPSPVFSTILPPAKFPRTGEPTVVVPPLHNNTQPSTTPTPPQNSSSPERGLPTIEFGQPLPKKLPTK
ncbi:MAG: AMIN domain-containing protein [Oscillatoria sp. PMC 1051.18]|nr:AMIN domain-containing protein [Oscillatoria sp. PMC 1050.18]MEC5032485.1 AMIN domain-containing protein [Oscillatoria sp. PMC 1051.18]